MARLGSDRFAQDGPQLTVEQAAALVAERIVAVTGTQTVALDDADGRVLAQDIVAAFDLPPFASSAVDGYAVRFADLAPSGETSLRLAGRVAAGADPAGLAARGVAVRVFTGAPLPHGADTVFMQEDVTLADGVVTLPQGLASGANARPAGEDIARGEIALPAGRRLRPQDVAALASLGLTQIVVMRRPRVALFSTGDELTEPGAALGPAAIYDANRSLLRTMIRRAGAEIVDLGILRDEPETLAAHLAEAAVGCDLILTSGGVSTGEEDHVKAAVEKTGALAFWRMGIKPGRPVAMGVVAGTPFIGLPGNPVAVFVTFAFVARPVIARLSGALYALPRPLPVRLGFVHRKKAGRREYLRVTLSQADDGVMVATRATGEGAGVLASLTQTDGLVELADDWTAIEPGTMAPFFDYAQLSG